ncbi:hypothetical protein MLD38_025663 [Melastoma candidum]|uniref:Uncharacterized protein n=1 Tax=Melastoma candidum TaxID=119954 RepID=A0ACB9P300_9MYRT|nr:hypothetical protein MLD38_025663 [Melastoma candidum]
MKQMGICRLGLSPHPTFLPLLWKPPAKPSRVSAARTDDPPPPTDDSRSINLSVLRITLGIPGLHESYLPRWIGYGFGSVLLLNHFLGYYPSSFTPAQLRTEALGLSVAAFSVFIPYIGKFLPALIQSLSSGGEAERGKVMFSGCYSVQRSKFARRQ